MTYEVFKTHLTNTLSEELGAKVRLNGDDFLFPDNDVSKDAIIIQIPGRRFMPVFYPRHLYDKLTSGTPFEEIIENVKDSIRYTNVDCLDEDEISDYSRAKKYIVPRLVRYDKNDETLMNRAHIEFLAFAVIFIYLIKHDEDELISFSIPVDFLSQWGISIEQLFADSVKNSEKIFPFTIDRIEDLICIENMEEDCKSFYVLSNKDQKYGATSIIYSHVLSDFADQIRESFYLIPSSVHEMLLIPESLGIQAIDMKEMLVSVNSTLEDNDVLSYKVYHYDWMTKTLDIAV